MDMGKHLTNIGFFRNRKSQNSKFDGKTQDLVKKTSAEDTVQNLHRIPIGFSQNPYRIPIELQQCY